MDKSWCNKCGEYTHQTTCGCVQCGQVVWMNNVPMGTDIVLSSKDFLFLVDKCELHMTDIKR